MSVLLLYKKYLTKFLRLYAKVLAITLSRSYRMGRGKLQMLDVPLFKCPYCERSFQRRGLRGHISFTHGGGLAAAGRAAEKVIAATVLVAGGQRAEKAALGVVLEAVRRAPVVLDHVSEKAGEAVAVSESDALVQRALDLSKRKKELEDLRGEPGLLSGLLSGGTSVGLALKQLRADERTLRKDFEAQAAEKVKADEEAEAKADEEAEADNPETAGWTNNEKVLVAGAGAALLLVLSPKLREALKVLFEALSKFAPKGGASGEATFTTGAETGDPYETERAAANQEAALASRSSVADMFNDG